MFKIRVFWFYWGLFALFPSLSREKRVWSCGHEIRNSMDLRGGFLFTKQRSDIFQFLTKIDGTCFSVRCRYVSSFLHIGTAFNICSFDTVGSLVVFTTITTTLHHTNSKAERIPFISLHKFEHYLKNTNSKTLTMAIASLLGNIFIFNLTHIEDTKKSDQTVSVRLKYIAKDLSLEYGDMSIRALYMRRSTTMNFPVV